MRLGEPNFQKGSSSNFRCFFGDNLKFKAGSKQAQSRLKAGSKQAQSRVKAGSKQAESRLKAASKQAQSRLKGYFDWLGLVQARHSMLELCLC